MIKTWINGYCFKIISCQLKIHSEPLYMVIFRTENRINDYILSYEVKTIMKNF